MLSFDIGTPPSLLFLLPPPSRTRRLILPIAVGPDFDALPSLLAVLSAPGLDLAIVPSRSRNAALEFWPPSQRETCSSLAPSEGHVSIP
ncbi:hypothetical protein AURDEDRAFT_174051 [Auricularia subglabra TFB-10046 SS5]|nr:hypothetical protein AURDEDRAFT_174051 [Auricularia subglabra TFB-10046 SS5]